MKMFSYNVFANEGENILSGGCAFRDAATTALCLTAGLKACPMAVRIVFRVGGELETHELKKLDMTHDAFVEMAVERALDILQFPTPTPSAN